jgi:RimJ/RimL family protein N-acetyltransferase
MKVFKYGICLERIEEQHIEMIRNWRNDGKIARHMFYTGQITAEMQREWFDSINNLSNFFFLINYEGSPVGLINISALDKEQKTAFSGLYIYNDTLLGTDIPVRASLSMLDLFFNCFGIEKVYAKVRGNNKVAHKYNSSLGFKRTKKIEYGMGFEYELEKKNYFDKAKKLRAFASRLSAGVSYIEFNSTALDGIIKMNMTEEAASC